MLLSTPSPPPTPSSCPDRRRRCQPPSIDVFITLLRRQECVRRHGLLPPHLLEYIDDAACSSGDAASSVASVAAVFEAAAASRALQDAAAPQR